MKFIPWLVAIAVALIPLGWLAMRNARAVPIGAFIVAIIAVVGFGAIGVGGAAVNSSVGAQKGILLLGATLAVLIAVALANLAWMTGPVDSRLNWAATSTGVWLLVVLIGSWAAGWSRGIDADRSSEAYWAPIRAAEARGAQLRAELDRHPERRAAVIDSALVAVKTFGEESMEKIERFVVFGDPARAPANVVIWAVVRMRPDTDWSRFGYYGERMQLRLNDGLRLGGYPAKVAFGVAPANAVDADGGDAGYFGTDGTRRVPQYPANHQVPGVPAPLAMP